MQQTPFPTMWGACCRTLSTCSEWWFHTHMARQRDPGQACTLQRTVSTIHAVLTHTQVQHIYQTYMNTFTHLFSALSQYKKCKKEKPLINNNAYKTWIVPLLAINRSVKVSVLPSYRLSVGSGWWWCVFTLTCAAWVLVSVVQQSFASDWVAGGCQQLFARWPLPSLGRQYCWVKVKLKESDSDRSSDISWWCKQCSRTVRPVVSFIPWMSLWFYSIKYINCAFSFFFNVSGAAPYDWDNEDRTYLK